MFPLCSIDDKLQQIVHEQFAHIYGKPSLSSITEDHELHPYRRVLRECSQTTHDMAEIYSKIRKNAE